jgi:hypothetical protein
VKVVLSRLPNVVIARRHPVLHAAIDAALRRRRTKSFAAGEHFVEEPATPLEFAQDVAMHQLTSCRSGSIAIQPVARRDVSIDSIDRKKTTPPATLLQALRTPSALNVATGKDVITAR